MYLVNGDNIRASYKMMMVVIMMIMMLMMLMMIIIVIIFITANTRSDAKRICAVS